MSAPLFSERAIVVAQLAAILAANRETLDMSDVQVGIAVRTAVMLLEAAEVGLKPKPIVADQPEDVSAVPGDATLIASGLMWLNVLAVPEKGISITARARRQQEEAAALARFVRRALTAGVK